MWKMRQVVVLQKQRVKALGSCKLLRSLYVKASTGLRNRSGREWPRLGTEVTVALACCASLPTRRPRAVEKVGRPPGVCIQDALQGGTHFSGGSPRLRCLPSASGGQRPRLRLPRGRRQPWCHWSERDALRGSPGSGAGLRSAPLCSARPALAACGPGAPCEARHPQTPPPRLWPAWSRSSCGGGGGAAQQGLRAGKPGPRPSPGCKQSSLSLWCVIAAACWGRQPGSVTRYSTAGLSSERRGAARGGRCVPLARSLARPPGCMGVGWGAGRGSLPAALASELRGAARTSRGPRGAVRARDAEHRVAPHRTSRPRPPARPGPQPQRLGAVRLELGKVKDFSSIAAPPAPGCFLPGSGLLLLPQQSPWRENGNFCNPALRRAKSHLGLGELVPFFPFESSILPAALCRHLGKKSINEAELYVRSVAVNGHISGCFSLLFLCPLRKGSAQSSWPCHEVVLVCFKL